MTQRAQLQNQEVETSRSELENIDYIQTLGMSDDCWRRQCIFTRSRKHTLLGFVWNDNMIDLPLINSATERNSLRFLNGRTIFGAKGADGRLFNTARISHWVKLFE